MKSVGGGWKEEAEEGVMFGFGGGDERAALSG